MATEYKLPYSGSEINRRLRDVDTKISVVTLTSAEYEALESTNANTLYSITDDGEAASVAYVDEKIAAIPTPDVSGQINTHNTATDSHADIRKQVSQLSSDKLNTSDLPAVINTALAQAKASGEFDGKDGTNGKDGQNGVSATHSWNGTTLTITSASGTSSANLKGEKGDKGSTGADGVSPTVAVSKSGKVTTVSITDKNGTKTATINDGADGSNGTNGKDGTSVTVKSVSESTADGGSNVVTFSDGKTVTIKNGSKGSTGATGNNGADGISPTIAVSKSGKVTTISITDKNGTKTATINDGADGASVSGTEVIPDYVITEAESVIDRIVSAQGNRTFTFAAITDMHYGNSSYTDGIKHACQALKYIDERVKLDAVAVLGDYTDGYPTTNITDAMADFKAVNSMLDKLRFTENLRLMGNHDYYAENIPVTRRLIQAYSDNVIWGSRIGGYFHRDFEDCKIRIICPNTNEINPMDASTNKPSSGISMTTTQMQWLIDTMDMSNKTDAEEWGILILSHHPLDYWTHDYQYILSYVLDAYKTGSNWSGSGVSCDFTGKNKAKLIGNIHGHIHNLLTDYMFKGASNGNVKSAVYRTCVPNSCYGRENQYDGVWAETSTYTKTKNTSDDTAFMVYVINLDRFTVNGICYGAGVDRSFAFGEAPLETYTITNNLTNITTSNDANTIIEGMSFTTTLTPVGENITSVKVTMGGTDVTNTVYSNGTISISKVTGNIVITAVGEAKVEIINLLDEAGYKNNTRLSTSSGSESTSGATGMVATGFIYVGDSKIGDVIRTRGIDFSYGSYPKQGAIVRYNSDKSFANSCYPGQQATNRIGQYTISYDTTNNDVTLTCDRANTGDVETYYLRFSGMCADGANAIITKNQIIE